MSQHKGSLAVVVTAVCLVSFASFAQAGPVDFRVDFNNASTSTPAGWTRIDDVGDGLVHDLADFNTGSTSDGVQLQGTTSFFNSTNIQTVAWTNAGAPWVDNRVFNDYTGLTGSGTLSGTITISGLSSTTAYQVDLLSARNTGGSDTSYLVGPTGNTVAGVVIGGSATTTAWNARDDGYIGNDFMQWSSVTPGADGKIVLDVSSDGNYAFFNGMRISAIPEPSAFLLLLFGGFGLLAARRRSRR